MTQPYDKPFLTIDQQIEKLKLRGMSVEDATLASDQLTEYGYYRLSGYWHPLRKYDLAARQYRDEFCDGATFETATALIEFDRKLRSLILIAAERIEIALRVRMAITLGQRGAWSHREPATYRDQFTGSINPRTGTTNFDTWQGKLNRLEEDARQGFAAHHRQKYAGPPPIWISIELWDFGMLSKLIGGLTNIDKEVLGEQFGIPRRILLPTWVRAINYARNVAAHHSRLWNISPIDQPKPPRLNEIPQLDHLATDQFAQTKVYAIAATMQHLLKSINEQAADAWSADIKALFNTFPEGPQVTFTQTGFPVDWQNLDLWT